jgi:hypothetical protein
MNTTTLNINDRVLINDLGRYGTLKSFTPAGYLVVELDARPGFSHGAVHTLLTWQVTKVEPNEPDAITKVEERIVSMIIDSILSSGYTLRVHDGELWASSVHDTKEQHMASIRTTDADFIVVFSPNTKKRIGMIYLVYGNGGYDVICDHTDNMEINDILAEVFAWIDEHEE